MTEDQIVRDITLAKEVAAQLRVSGISWRSTISVPAIRPSPACAICRLPNSRSTALSSGLLDRCHQCRDLPDRDRSGHRFGSAAAAEGIESAADLQALMVMGCDFGQGVLIAPPMPKERFLELLRQRLQPAPPGVAARRHGGRAKDRRPRRLRLPPRRYSRNGAGAPSGTGMRKTSSVIEIST